MDIDRDAILYLNQEYDNQIAVERQQAQDNVRTKLSELVFIGPTKDEDRAREETRLNELEATRLKEFQERLGAEMYQDFGGSREAADKLLQGQEEQRHRAEEIQRQQSDIAREEERSSLQENNQQELRQSQLKEEDKKKEKEKKQVENQKTQQQNLEEEKKQKLALERARLREQFSKQRSQENDRGR